MGGGIVGWQELVSPTAAHKKAFVASTHDVLFQEPFKNYNGTIRVTCIVYCIQLRFWGG